MPKITIHTATYNRAYILSKAYESLRAQTCKDFEWIITDDGSSDDTELLVEAWMREDNGFPIIYNKLNHVGLNRALDSGIEKSNSDWFMRLDSDDTIIPETVEKVLLWINEIKDNDSFVGIGYAKCYPDGSYMRNQIPIIDFEVGYVDATNIERKKLNMDMDMNEVYRTELLRKYPATVWKGEMFSPEQLVTNKIALDGYKIRWRADKLYICEYRDDGLTKDNLIVKNNPMGYAMMYNQNIIINKSFVKKCKSAIQMTALSIYAGNISYLKESNCKAATILTLPLGALLAVRRKKQFK
ncbi:MAG: glycosyltransferase family 2 protein [Eubacterium sp.]|nr:glycosyltransferase family 2 protein [Eubacterium sp.]